MLILKEYPQFKSSTCLCHVIVIFLLLEKHLFIRAEPVEESIGRKSNYLFARLSELINASGLKFECLR